MMICLNAKLHIHKQNDNYLASMQLVDYLQNIMIADLRFIFKAKC